MGQGLVLVWTLDHSDRMRVGQGLVLVWTLDRSDQMRMGQRLVLVWTLDHSDQMRMGQWLEGSEIQTTVHLQCSILQLYYSKFLVLNEWTPKVGSPLCQGIYS